MNFSIFVVKRNSGFDPPPPGHTTMPSGFALEIVFKARVAWKSENQTSGLCGKLMRVNIPAMVFWFVPWIAWNCVSVFISFCLLLHDTERQSYHLSCLCLLLPFACHVPAYLWFNWLKLFLLLLLFLFCWGFLSLKSPQDYELSQSKCLVID